MGMYNKLPGWQKILKKVSAAKAEKPAAKPVKKEDTSVSPARKVVRIEMPWPGVGSGRYRFLCNVPSSVAPGQHIMELYINGVEVEDPATDEWMKLPQSTLNMARSDESLKRELENRCNEMLWSEGEYESISGEDVAASPGAVIPSLEPEKPASDEPEEV